MELSVEISPEDDPEKVREFLEKLEVSVCVCSCGIIHA